MPLVPCLKSVRSKRTYHSGRKVSYSHYSILFSDIHTFAAAKLGHDFRSNHMLLVVHVWMIHKRLQREGKPGLQVQEALFDALWDDSSNRIHLKGIPEISV